MAKNNRATIPLCTAPPQRRSPLLNMFKLPLVQKREHDRKHMNMKTVENKALAAKRGRQAKVTVRCHYPDVKVFSDIPDEEVDELMQLSYSQRHEPGDGTEEAELLELAVQAHDVHEAATRIIEMAELSATLPLDPVSCEILSHALRGSIERGKDRNGMQAELASHLERSITPGYHVVTLPGFADRLLTNQVAVSLASLFQAAGVPLVGTTTLRRTITTTGEDPAPLFKGVVTTIVRDTSLEVLKSACQEDRWPELKDHVLHAVASMRIHVASEVTVMYDLVDPEGNSVSGRAVGVSVVHSGCNIYVQAGASSLGGELGRELSRLVNPEGQVLPDLAFAFNTRLGRIAYDAIHMRPYIARYNMKPLGNRPLQAAPVATGSAEADVTNSSGGAGGGGGGGGGRPAKKRSRIGDGKDTSAAGSQKRSRDDPNSMTTVAEEVGKHEMGPITVTAMRKIMKAAGGKLPEHIVRALAGIAGYMDLKELLWGAADVKLVSRYWKTGKHMDIRVRMGGVETRVLVKASTKPNKTVFNLSQAERVQAAAHSPTILMHITGACTKHMSYSMTPLR